MTPAEIAASIEESPELPEGDDERFAGWGVMAAPFSSGDLLAMRRFPASSLGSGYTTVWHRTPAGEWTIYTDSDPLKSCPRYMGRALAHVVETEIRHQWTAPSRLEVEVPAAQLTWTMELAQTGTTRFMNALARAMSERMWRSPRVLAMMSRVAGRLLHAGRLGLSGRLPNGQWFIANPMNVWIIPSSRATVAGRDLGTLAPLPEQARLGDFFIPQRGLFAFGRGFFEPLDPTRHLTHAP
jgi:hypothetical protein